MATSSKTSVEVTDCPYCQSLCLNPIILPCGHVVCRKCLHKLMDNCSRHMAHVCHSCGHSLSLTKGQTISELEDQLGKDPVLEDLVTQKLALQNQIYCMVCRNKVATTECLDCGDVYCDVCAGSHKKMTVSRDHLLQNLPRTLYRKPPAAPQTPESNEDVMSSTSGNSNRYDMVRNSLWANGRRSWHARCSARASCGRRLPEDRLLLGHDTRPRQNNDKESLRQEAHLCQKGATLFKDVVSAVEASIVQLQKVKDRLENKQLLLSSYATRLSGPDHVVMSNARAMLSRVRRVREECRPPAETALTELTKLTEHAHKLVDKAEILPGLTSFDPMTSSSQITFTVKPDVVGDTHKDGPFITSIVATGDDRVVMADQHNSMIKIAELTDPANSVRGVKVDTAPYSLALLPGSQVAVTADMKRIYFVDISGQLSVASRVKTVRQYRGVASVTDDDTLVVGCRKEGGSAVRVDVITRAGFVVRTVADSNTIPGLKSPDNLCFMRGCVLVSDCDAHVVHKVELWVSQFANNAAYGRVVGELTHPDLEYPSQVTSDSNGNCYIASIDGHCVLVVSPEAQWRRLLYVPEEGDGPRVEPWGVCVTNTGVLVTWDKLDGYSVLLGYDLTESFL